MPTFIGSFRGARGAFGSTILHQYPDCTKEEAIKRAREDAEEMMCKSYDLCYIYSWRRVGSWVKKGSRWYKE